MAKYVAAVHRLGMQGHDPWGCCREGVLATHTRGGLNTQGPCVEAVRGVHLPTTHGWVLGLPLASSKGWHQTKVVGRVFWQASVRPEPALVTVQPAPSGRHSGSVVQLVYSQRLEAVAPPFCLWGVCHCLLWLCSRWCHTLGLKVC